MKLRLSGGSRSKAKPPMPLRSDSVLLAVPGGQRFPARVLDCGADSIQVAIVVLTKGLGPRALKGLVVEYHAPQGRVQLRGEAAVENPSEPDVIRVNGPLTVQVLQEREYVRVSTARPVIVYTGRGREKVQTFTVDVSGGGLLLAGPDTLAIGDKVEFRLSVSREKQPITGSAEVVRIDPKGRRAVAFREISEADRRRLVRFIFELQRAERRRGVRVGDANG